MHSTNPGVKIKRHGQAMRHTQQGSRRVRADGQGWPKSAIRTDKSWPNETSAIAGWPACRSLDRSYGVVFREVSIHHILCFPLHISKEIVKEEEQRRGWKEGPRAEWWGKRLSVSEDAVPAIKSPWPSSPNPPSLSSPKSLEVYVISSSSHQFSFWFPCSLTSKLKARRIRVLIPSLKMVSWLKVPPFLQRYQMYSAVQWIYASRERERELRWSELGF